MIFDGRCSNKNCSLRAAVKPAAEKKHAARVKTTGKSAATAKLSVKAANPRRASKCITYNLYDDNVHTESED